MANDVYEVNMEVFEVQPEDFEAEGFDPDGYVAMARRHLPLGTLKRQLEAVKDDIHGELYQLINDDYAAFLALSTDLAGLDSGLAKVGDPLASARAQVAALHGALVSARAAFAAKVEERAALASARASLALCLDAGRCVDKLEALLGLGGASGAGAGGAAGRAQPQASRIDSHVIERVGAELNRALHYVDSGSDLAFVQGLIPRLAAVQDALRDSLRETFLGALGSADRDGLKLALRTYIAVDGVADAEAAVADHVVSPALDPIFTKGKLESGSMGSHAGLPSMYDAVLGVLRRPQLRLLLELARETDSSSPLQAVGRDGSARAGATAAAAQRFEFMGNAVMASVVRLIDARIPQIFAPGMPDVFHTNFCATVAFLDGIEAVVGPRSSVEAFRASDAYETFMRRWNLPVYFQLVFQRVTPTFQDAFSAPLSLATVAAAGDPAGTDTDTNTDSCAAPAAAAVSGALEQTQALERALGSLWGPDVVLRPLIGSFIKLSLQMLARYTSWAGLVLDRRTLGPDSDTPVSLFELAALDGDIGVLESSGVATLAATATRYADNPAAAELVDKTVRGARAGLVRLHAVIDTALTARAMDDLDPLLANELAALPRSYRGMSRPTPAAHSDYISSVHDTVTSFETSVMGVVPDDRIARWSSSLLSSAALAWVAHADAVITSVKNAADSLRRLRRGKPSADDANTADTIKIYQQLLLDAQALAAPATPLSADATTALAQVCERLGELIQQAV